MMVTFDASAQALDIQTITVTGIPDTEAEGTEVLGVTIVADTGTTYRVDGDGNGFSEFVNINVLDDDSKPVIQKVLIIWRSVHLLVFVLFTY